MAAAGGRRTCPSCGSVWVAATARFCGRCGQVLLEPAPSGAPPRGLRSGVVAVLVVAVAAAVTLLGTADRQAERPQQGEVVEFADPAAPSSRAEEVACAPTGCERWRAGVGPGDVLVLADRIFHKSRSRLSAIDAADGRLLWDRPLDESPLLTGAVIRRSEGRAWDVGGDLLLFAPALAERRLDARSASDGELLWSHPTDTIEVVAATRLGAQVIVAGYDQRGEAAGPLAGRITALRPDDGAVVWTRPVQRLETVFLDAAMTRWVHSTAAIVDTRVGQITTPTVNGSLRREVPLVVRTADSEVAALDPATGEPRWTFAPSLQVAVASSGAEVLVLGGDGVARIVAADTGAVRREFDLEVPAEAGLHLHGGLVLVEEPPEDGVGDMTVTVHSGGDGAVLVERVGFPAGTVLTEGGLVLATMRRVEDGGDAGRLELVAIDPAGGVLWGWSSAVSWRECCWFLVDGGDDRSVLLTKNRLRDLEVIRLDRRDGTILERIELQPVPRGEADRMEFVWHPLLTVGRSGRDLLLSGPAGRVHLAGAHEVVSMDPLLVASRETLVAVDEHLLLGDRYALP